jgi:hypothetical protein
MSMLNIAKKLEKIKKHEACNCKECSNQAKALYEAKADTQRLIDFAGEDLAKRFIDIKNKLKAPENDLYYWIKNKSVEELEQAILNAEGATSITKAKKDIADKGAKLVTETSQWKVYYITTFEAAQKYGRDSKWCITGVNDYGDRYWQQYRSQGVEFYFLITKGAYDPRGNDSKFAIAVYPGKSEYEVFDQQDVQCHSIEDIPGYEELNIPGLDFSEMSSNHEYMICYYCEDEVSDEESWINLDGEVICDNCYPEHYTSCAKCANSVCIDDDTPYDSDHYAIQNAYGEYYCKDCWDSYLDDDRSYADSFISAAEDGNFFEDATAEDFEEGGSNEIYITTWVRAKEAGTLNMSAKEISRIEKDFIDNLADLGIDISPERFNIHDYNYLNDPENTGYIISVDNSDKRATRKNLHVEKALEEILAFINKLTPEEKDNTWLSWRCADDFNPAYDNENDFMNNYEGELVVSIYSKDELNDMSVDDLLQDKTIANYDEAEDKIRAALGIPEKIRESLHNTSNKGLTESYKPNKNKMSVLDEFSFYESLWK